MLAPDGKAYQCFTFENDKLKIKVMDWGATWLSCQKKSSTGMQEMLLSCELADFHQQKVYMGATVGRYANRIANAKFTLNEKNYSLTASQGKHCLHGGRGVSQMRWQIKEKGDNFIIFSHFSPDGEDGFPGNCEMTVTYRLIDNQVRIEHFALCDKDCPISLTNHAYFNLDGADQGVDIRQHQLKINASHFLPVNDEGIPDKPLTPVAQSILDFSEQKTICHNFGQGLQSLTKGIDHSFLLEKNSPFAVQLYGTTGNTLTVQTSQPVAHIYTGNYLAGTPAKKDQQNYSDFAGIAIETQVLPDTPNHPEWWQYGGISKAHEPYEHWTNFIFA